MSLKFKFRLFRPTLHPGTHNSNERGFDFEVVAPRQSDYRSCRNVVLQ